jgi:hypothetical protein
MVNLISSNSSTGVYLVIEENNQISGNTPNGIDLDNLTLATGYMYFDKFLSLVLTGSTPYNDNFTGWDFGQSSNPKLKTTGGTGAGKLVMATLTVHVDATEQQNFLKFWETHISASAYQLYLLRQWASTTFKQFPYNGTLYKYLAVCPVGFTLTEANQQGKDTQTLVITMANAYRTVTP